jgi:hypothetical protein
VDVTTPGPGCIVRIGVRIQVGSHLMAATDDPLFLGLRGPAGREFRLLLATGRALRRGAEDHFVIGAPDDPATNLEHPDLNDPTSPPLAARDVTGLYLRKGFEPIPNVRGRGEMDDRIEVAAVEVEIAVEGQPKALRFARQGPLWLGLAAGLEMEIPRADTGA